MLVPMATQSLPGSYDYSGERLVNYFARPVSGVAPAVLLARGGLVSYADLTNPVRALIDMGGSLYAVANGQVRNLTAGTTVGTVDDGVTSVAANASQIAIVVGGKYYICDGSATTQYSTGAVTAPIDVDTMDGYFVVVGTSGGRQDGITVSGLDDGTTFDSLDFAFAEKLPDALVGVLRDHDRLWLFGTKTVQLYYNSGNPDFPLSPVAGATIEHGCQAGTPAKAANLVYWVRPDGAVMSSGGVEPQVVSTPEIKTALAASTVSGGFTFSERGHEFYAVVRNGTTLCFDITTGLWAERAAGLDYAAWQATTAHEFGGATYFGCSTGNVATSSATTFTDFGGVMLTEAVSQPVQTGDDRFRISKVHANFAGGQTLAAGGTVVLQLSENGGRSFGRERHRTLPGQGQHGRRVTWHSLGAFYRVNARLWITDAVPRDLVGVTYE